MQTDFNSVDDLFQGLRQHLATIATHTFPALKTGSILIGQQATESIRKLDNWLQERVVAQGRTKTRQKGGTIALLVGAPANVKEQLSALLASRASLPLKRIDLSSVVSRHIKETEQNLQQVFEAAENKGAVLFFDEADALFGKRSEIRDAHDRYANIEANNLLAAAEQQDGLTIIGVTSKSHIDPAFLRRLRFLIDFSSQ